MAVTTEQKVDFLLKKVGYSLSKTGSVTGTGAISGGTTKEPFAETLASPITVRSTSIWADSTYIPATPPGSDTGYVKGYRAAASGHRMTADSTVAGSRAFIAYTTYNNTSSGILGDWINTQFGADYIVEVYKGDPNSGGVKLSAAGSGSDDTWFFDYTSGILNFNGAALPSGVTDTNVYIVGYRYLGTRGVQPPGGIGTFHNLYVSGLSTFVGVGTFNSHLYVGGNLEVKGTTSLFGGTITLGDAATDNVVFNADVDSNIIPDDNNTYDLGSNSQRWKKIYVNNVGIGTSTIISDDITTRHLKVTGIGTFDQQLLVTGNVNVSGVSTFGSIGINTGVITGPANMYIDPATVGDNTGLLVIKGNLQVDGTQTTVNSTTMTVDDKNIVLGQGAANDAAIDGGGITLESSGGGNKLLTWIDSTDSWTSSEHFDLAAGKSYDIAGTEIIHSARATLGGTLSVAGITTVKQLEIGTLGQTLVGINTILDEDDMASNSATALATQQSIKAYVDAGDTAQDLDFFADSGGALSIDLDSESLELAGTTNEITTVGAGNSVTIGLPDNVIVGNGLTVTGKSTFTKEVGISSALTVTGISTFNANVHLLDDDRLRIGGSVGTFDGLELYHEGSDSYINDSGTGDLKINGSGIEILSAADTVRIGSVLAYETQIFHSNAEKLASKVWGINVTGTLDTDQLVVSGIATVATFNVGVSGTTLVGINTILDEDNMSSDSATALATQQSIKKYVDDRTPGGPGGGALTVSADSGSNESIDLATEALDIEGTANEIETVTGTNKVIIGLPDDVTIADDLTVTGDIASVTNLNVTGVSTFTGAIDANGALDVDGTSDLDQVNIAAGLNVTAGISTFAELIKATKSVQGSENLVISGLSTFSSNVDVNASADISGNLIVGVAGTSLKTVVGAAVSVGIGSATPDYMLDVAGAINSETDVKIQGVSVVTQALNDAVAMAIALG